MTRLAAAAAALTLAACATVEPIDPVGTDDGTVVSSADDAGDTAGSSGTAGGASGSSTAGGGSDGTATSTAGTGGLDESGGSDSPGCQVGQEGCPCTPEGACDAPLQCLSELCVDTGQGCPIGSEGCPCTRGGACDPGLACASMVCVDPDG